MRCVACAVFDDLYSLAHFFFGALLRLAGHASLEAAAAAIAAYAMFLLYEIVEDRARRECGRAKCDILEMLMGYVAGDLAAPLITY